VSQLNLVDRSRYFGPDSAMVQVVEFLPYFNPALRLLGDFVSRTVLIRADYWQSILRRYLVQGQSAQQIAAPYGDSWWQEAEESLQRARAACEELRARCLIGPEAQIRGACIALLQVYASYRPQADLTWLGLVHAQPNAADVRGRVENRYETNIAEQIAAALLQVMPLYRSSLCPEDVIAEKVPTHALVVIIGRARREVYWQGTLVNADWSKRTAQWELLAALAERGKTGEGVDAMDLTEGKSAGLKDRRSRLKQLLPEDLDAKIHACGGGTYRLCLAAKEICVLRHRDDDRLSELD
jgi:hypothetical protein